MLSSIRAYLFNAISMPNSSPTLLLHCIWIYTSMHSQRMCMNLMSNSSPTLLLHCIWIYTSMHSQRMCMNLMSNSSPTLLLHCIVDLYLNAISKNVYEPYVQQFSNFVVALYCIWIYTSMQSQRMCINLMSNSSPTLLLHCIVFGFIPQCNLKECV
jgi:hypothetical protein